jgi:hypothetical protein
MNDKAYEVTVVWSDGVREVFRSDTKPDVSFLAGVLTLTHGAEETTLLLQGVRYVTSKEIQ